MSDLDSKYEYELGYRLRNDRRDVRLRMLEDRIQENTNENAAEAEMRRKSPALQYAWEQYQIILKTISNVN